jgi:hypothetical protein
MIIKYWKKMAVRGHIKPVTAKNAPRVHTEAAT